MSQPKVQVAGTNDYSIHSKASIVANGYAEDPYLCWFVGDQNMARVRRSPIINRGYYVRHRALENAFRRVLLSEDSNSNCSSKNIVISLGAGFDTSALRYHEASSLFIELDYPAVCQRKAAILQSRRAQLPFQCSAEKLVFEGASKNSSFGPFIISPRYLLLGVDLRQPEEVVKVLEDEKVGEVLLKAATVNRSSSISNFILLNECSLCYIAREDADALLARLISYFTEKLSNKTSNQLTFTYLGYEMLASTANTEDYGRFLRRHFDAMGAGILTFLSEAEIAERFLNSKQQGLNFDQLEVINMKNFWREQLNSNEAERKRIRALEPFDEFEELDSVCASYSLTIARKGGGKALKEKSKTGVSLLGESELPSPSSFLHPIGQHEHLLSVFGHCSHFDAEKDRLRIFGGFGRDPDGKKANTAAGHRRLRQIVQFQLSPSEELNNKSPPYVFTPRLHYPSSTSPQAINRVHAQVVYLGSQEDTSRYLLSGGRTSPAAIQESALIEIDEQAAEYRLHPLPSMNQQVEYQGTVISAQAFRHVCARFGARSEQVVQFGGISTGGDVVPPNGAVFLFDIDSSFDVTTRRVSPVRKLDTHRHSAAFTTFGDHCLLLNGGLDLATDGFQSRFASLELIDQREMVVNQLKLNGGLPLLYGHRMQQIGEYEVLVVGGIGEKRIENAAFRIDLRAPAVTAKYHLQCLPQSLLMLTNHTTALIADGHRLCIIGGGGNCFSFGTHFNPLLEYDLSKTF